MKYHIRVYAPTEQDRFIINEAIGSKAFSIINSYDGMNGMLSIYDGECSSEMLKWFISLGIKFFPLNNYGDFIITCPNCGERIDDDMILTIYDENLLSGYNILCERDDCGCQMANVEYIL